MTDLRYHTKNSIQVFETMDEIKISEGQFKIGELLNWEELCSKLSLTCKRSGNSKKLQLADIERYIKLEKKGHKYKIIEIYDNPAPKIRKAKYANLALPILLTLNRLQRTSNLTFYTAGASYVSNKGLYIILGLCNSSIFDSQSNRLRRIRDAYSGLITNAEHEEAYISFYYRNIEDVRNIFTSIRRTLVNRGSVFWVNVFILKFSNGVIREANKAEAEVIKKYQTLTLLEMNLKNEYDVISVGRWVEYNNKTMDTIKLFEKENKITNCIESFSLVNKIEITRTSLESGLQQCSERSRNELNSVVIDKLLQTNNKLLKEDKSARIAKLKNPETFVDWRVEKNQLDSKYPSIAEKTIISHHAIDNYKEIAIDQSLFGSEENIHF